MALPLKQPHQAIANQHRAIRQPQFHARVPPPMPVSPRSNNIGMLAATCVGPPTGEVSVNVASNPANRPDISANPPPGRAIAPPSPPSITEIRSVSSLVSNTVTGAQVLTGLVLGTAAAVLTAAAWSAVSFQFTALRPWEMLLPWWGYLTVWAIYLLTVLTAAWWGLHRVTISPLGWRAGCRISASRQAGWRC